MHTPGQMTLQVRPDPTPPPLPPPPSPHKAPPADWASAVAAADSLFSNTPPRDGFHPSVGNGFIAGGSLQLS